MLPDTVRELLPSVVAVLIEKGASIDLVVIGSRGYGDIKSLFLGSVSHKVVESCACPCLVVK